MTRNSFVFYRSFYDAFKTLTDEDFGKCARAVIEYALEGQEPQPGGIGYLTLGLVRPLLDKNNKRYENGCKGGRPNGNQAETKEEPNAILNDKCKMINDKWEKDIESFPPSSEKICAADAPPNAEGAPKRQKSKDKPPEYSEEIKQIVDYLNQRIGTSYRPSSKDTRSHITARLREGYTVDDFEVVIDKMSNVWLGSEMERYLRPSTLFGPKFEGYLNGNFSPRTSSKAQPDELWQYICENIG